jgi:hypothetical protein
MFEGVFVVKSRRTVYDKTSHYIKSDLNKLIMSQAQPEYSIILSILGVLFAIGIPSLNRGELLVGGLCIGLAVAVAIGWVLVMRGSRP